MQMHAQLKKHRFEYLSFVGFCCDFNNKIFLHAISEHKKENQFANVTCKIENKTIKQFYQTRHLHSPVNEL